MNRPYKLSSAAIVLGILTIFGVSITFASPGDIDPTFRSGGYVTSTFGGAGYASALQTDGKIVLVGRASNDFTLLRYHSDGTLDASFGTNGRVTTNIDGDNEIAFAAAIQPDGKIVVVGQFQNGGDFQYDFGIVRYNSDGTLDTSFGTGGKTSVSIGDREDIARSVIIQPDGKILVGGSAWFAGNTAEGRFAVVRYNHNGTLDTTFDGDGKAVVQQNGYGDFALQTDGKIVVASSDGYSADSKFAISRLNPDGSVDTSFGNAGKVNTSFDDGGSSAYSVVVQTDGKIIAAGVSHYNGSQRSDFGIARYNSNGSLDTSFDGDGKVITSFGSTDDVANKIILQSDNKIIVAGAAQGNPDGPAKGFALARYNEDGTLDTFFGNAGKTTALLLGGEYLYDAELQVDGKIIAVGTGRGFQTRFVAIRLTSNGSLDQTFNPNTAGQVTVPLGEINAANAVITQPDGKIVAAGATSTALLLDFSIARFNADGTPDLTFGVGGKTSTSVSSSIDGALAVALQPDGKIVAAGYSGFPATTDFAVVRYNPDGSLDKTFDNDGIVILARSGGNEAATGVVIQSDGKIVIGGYTDTSSTTIDFFLARLNINGSLDTTFGSNGTVRTPIGPDQDVARALLQQPDGKLIAAGTSRTAASNGDFAAVRYNTNGSLDSTFGVNGKIVTSIGNGNDDGNAAALQSDGKIIVAGVTADGVNTNFALVRYLSNGTVDTSFGLNGKVITRVGNNSYAEAVTVQPNGRIIVVGEKLIGSTSDIAVVRYNTTGLLDQTFGTGGIVTTDINNRRDNAKAVVFQGTDKILVAGGTYDSSQNPPQSDLIVLRYLANTKTVYDFDGDGISDNSLFRPANGIWYLNRSASGFTGIQFGSAGDKLVPADYDGDGKTDVAVYRNGNWYLQGSTLGFTSLQFGETTDIPVPADFDGDGRTDVAVYRPSSGTWYLQRSRDGFTGVQFGLEGDVPIGADFDGDGRADLAVFRPSTGTWYVQQSTAGLTGVQFGSNNDKLVVADYDGDGKADFAVYRPSTGFWYLLGSQAGFTGVQFGQSGDLPVPADYDGDGKADIAVYRNDTWFIQRSTAGFTGIQFGGTNDQPIPNAFVR